MVFAPIAPGLEAIWTENSVTFRIGIAYHWHVYYVFFGHPLSYSTMALALILVELVWLH